MTQTEKAPTRLSTNRDRNPFAPLRSGRPGRCSMDSLKRGAATTRINEPKADSNRLSRSLMVRIQNRRFNPKPFHVGSITRGVHAETTSTGFGFLTHVDSIDRARDLKGANCKAPQRKLKGWPPHSATRPGTYRLPNRASGIQGESLWKQSPRLYLEGLALFVLPPHRPLSNPQKRWKR